MRRSILALGASFVLAGFVALAALGGTGTGAIAQTPYSVIVDNAETGRFVAPSPWGTSSYSSQRYGANYAFAEPGQGEAARFKVDVPKTGQYTVYARWPADRGYNAATPIGVNTTSGLQWTRVDQRQNGGRWMQLGTYELAPGDRDTVYVSRYATGTGYVVADAVRVVEASGGNTGGGNTGGSESSAPRGADNILGAALYGQPQVQRYASSQGCTRYITEAIPHYYDLAPRVGIAPDVLVAQAILETGCGRYGGDSAPWNMAGIKRGGATGDTPRDFERPATAYEGVRMHVNHMAAYTDRPTIGTPHARYSDARAVQQNRGYWVTRVSQLGGGTWATDPAYSGKLRNILDTMGRS